MELTVDVSAKRGGFELRAQLDLPKGVTALLGANGSGKTTLLHAIAGVIPTYGRIVLRGRTLLDTQRSQRVPANDRGIGVVFQDLRLFPHMTVARNLSYGGGTPSNALIDALQLGELLERYPSSLSGGQRQRVALGRTLNGRPQALLLDEPLAALDTRARRHALSWIRRATDTLSIPVLFATHRWAEARALSRHVITMDGGCALFHDAFDDLAVHPDTAATALALGLDNVIDIEGKSFWGQALRLPPADGTPSHHVAIRPRDVVLSAGPTHTSARNTLKGVVDCVTPVGQRRLVAIVGETDPRRLVVEVTPDAVDDLALKAGRSVFCLIKTSALRWL